MPTNDLTDVFDLLDKLKLKLANSLKNYDVIQLYLGNGRIRYANGMTIMQLLRAVRDNSFQNPLQLKVIESINLSLSGTAKPVVHESSTDSSSISDSRSDSRSSSKISESTDSVPSSSESEDHKTPVAHIVLEESRTIEDDDEASAYSSASNLASRQNIAELDPSVKDNLSQISEQDQASTSSHQSAVSERDAQMDLSEPKGQSEPDTEPEGNDEGNDAEDEAESSLSSMGSVKIEPVEQDPNEIGPDGWSATSFHKYITGKRRL